MRVAEGGMAVRWKDCERMTFRNPYNARANATATPEAVTRAAAPAERPAARAPRRANATARGEHGPIVGPTRRHRAEAAKKARREAHAGSPLGP